MPAKPFVDALNEQIAREFGASQQYLAVAIWYDDATLPPGDPKHPQPTGESAYTRYLAGRPVRHALRRLERELIKLAPRTDLA